MSICYFCVQNDIVEIDSDSVQSHLVLFVIRKGIKLGTEIREYTDKL